MKAKRILAAVATSLIGSTALAGGPMPAAAPNEPIALSNGFYIEGYFGYGYVDADSGSSRTSSVAGGGAIGYKANDNWGMDGGYTQMPHANVSTNYVYVTAKYMFPLTQKWSIFAKIGPAYVHGSKDPRRSASDGLALFAGAGGIYTISPRIGIVAQTAITTSNDNVPFTFNVTGGLDYFF